MRSKPIGEDVVGQTGSGKHIWRRPFPDSVYVDWSRDDHIDAVILFTSLADHPRVELVEGHRDDMERFHDALAQATLSEELGKSSFTARDYANKLRRRANKKIKLWQQGLGTAIRQSDWTTRKNPPKYVDPDSETTEPYDVDDGPHWKPSMCKDCGRPSDNIDHRRNCRRPRVQRVNPRTLPREALSIIKRGDSIVGDSELLAAITKLAPNLFIYTEVTDTPGLYTMWTSDGGTKWPFARQRGRGY